MKNIFKIMLFMLCVVSVQDYLFAEGPAEAPAGKSGVQSAKVDVNMNLLQNNYKFQQAQEPIQETVNTNKAPGENKGSFTITNKENGDSTTYKDGKAVLTLKTHSDGDMSVFDHKTGSITIIPQKGDEESYTSGDLTLISNTAKAHIKELEASLSPEEVSKIRSAVQGKKYDQSENATKTTENKPNPQESSKQSESNLVNQKKPASDLITKDNWRSALGISKDATFKDIKKAYHTWSLKNHPDKNKNDSNATSNFQTVSEQYSNAEAKN